MRALGWIFVVAAPIFAIAAMGHIMGDPQPGPERAAQVREGAVRALMFAIAWIISASIGLWLLLRQRK